MGLAARDPSSGILEHRLHRRAEGPDRGLVNEYEQLSLPTLAVRGIPIPFSMHHPFMRAQPARDLTARRLSVLSEALELP